MANRVVLTLTAIEKNFRRKKIIYNRRFMMLQAEYGHYSGVTTEE
jgi:hypothetical protein